MNLKQRIDSMMAETYTFNHLQLNDIEPEDLRVMLIEAFRRITILEQKSKEKEGTTNG